MDYIALPGVALRPSQICLGAGGFGSALSAEAAWAILDAFAERGGNFADTAHIYAAWLPGGAGVSERTLGGWIRARGVRRAFLIGTKGGHPDLAAWHISRLSPEAITHDLTESLERLDTDYIDLYWLHRDDPAIPVGEILGVLNEHMAAGRVRAIGGSNWSTARLAEAAGYAAAHGLKSFCASQIGYSLAGARTGPATSPGTLYMDAATWEWHRQTRLPVVAFSSQATGFFSGKYHAPAPGDNGGVATDKDRTTAAIYFSPENFGRLERAQALARKHGRTANEIALAYLLSQPFPVLPIVGNRTVAQVAGSCAATELRLTPEEAAWLEKGS